jgi:signal transduction histidine kinase
LSAGTQVELPFRPRARLLQLIGDQLIGNARLAVFELVKNAFDADASHATVTLKDLNLPTASISVEDDGEGMSLDVLKDVWLAPGHDFRERQRQNGIRTAKYHRLPLGEKGLGRFAVHKLGNLIEVVTRAKSHDECVVRIDWAELIRRPFLADAPVTIQVRTAEMFKADRTGTVITIGDLRQRHWTRGDVRRLQRQITSISAPFDGPDRFEPTLKVPGSEEWLADIPDVQTILDRAIWRFDFRIEDGLLDWTYEFSRIPGLRLEGREVVRKQDPLLLPPDSERKRVTADRDYQNGIGPIWGRFYVYDREREILRLLTESKLITDYLDENGGIRVYRDGIRVYNYGEPGDDWLGLDLRRVNVPTRNISRNIVIGAVHLSLEKSAGLIEKTSREGFVDNEASHRLRQLVLGALGTLEAERQKDKENIRALTSKGEDPEIVKIKRPLEDLRRALDKEGIRQRFERYLAKIEKDYDDMRQTLLHAGMAGMNLAVVFHEVERGVRMLHKGIEQGQDLETLELQSRDLSRLLDGFASLLRRDERRKHKASTVIERARKLNVLRFQFHRISFASPVLKSEKLDFEASFSFGLILSAMNNLIDNSIYWLQVRWPEKPAGDKPSPRRLYVSTNDSFEEGPAIVIADNGPGLRDDPERLVRPFVTHKTGGMGLGLYYANLVMELNGGYLRFPDAKDIGIPAEYDGAAVALVFKSEAK